MEDRLRSMWGYRYQERMSRERLYEVLDEKVILQLNIRLLYGWCW